MTILLTIYTLALAALNGIRIFDSTYWYDEMFSIKLIRLPVPELLAETAADVHPPLYYLILKGICHFAGESGPVLHAASLLPYLLVLVLALTVISKRFGRSAAFLFVTLASLLASSVKFNVEIRMYAWVVLFVLLSYLSLYAILYKNRPIYYGIFILSSLAAAYTHYYALIAVAFLYFVLMLYALIARREILGRVVLTWILTAAGYLRWLMVLLQTFGRTSEGWWMKWMPKYKDSLPAIFEGKHDWILFYIFAAVLTVTVICRIAEIAAGKKILPERSGDGTGADPGKELVFLLAGAASVFGTIAVGVGVSHLFRPMYFDRYIYTAAVCAWLILSAGLSGLRVRGAALLAIAVTIFVCYCGYFNYTEIYRQDTKDAAWTEASVQCIADISGRTDTPTLTDKDTDIRILAFFPHDYRNKLEIRDGLDAGELVGGGEIEKGKEYCLVASRELTAEEVQDLAKNGITCTPVRPELFKDDPDRGGFLGDLDVWIYDLNK